MSGLKPCPFCGADHTHTEVKQLKIENERLKRERDAAVKELFCWTRCPVCKHWSPADEWCEKHDRHADSFDGCDNPEWRGVKEGAEDD